MEMRFESTFPGEAFIASLKSTRKPSEYVIIQQQSSIMVQLANLSNFFGRYILLLGGEAE